MAIVFMYAVWRYEGDHLYPGRPILRLIFAYLVPAFFISMLITGVPIPQIGLGAEVIGGGGLSVLEKLDQTIVELGFTPYTDGSKSTIDVFAITMALMIGTAGLPHVIVRFFTVPSVADARKSAGYALLFIAILYTTAPAVGAFARLNFVETVHNTQYTEVDGWFKSWEDIGLIGWADKNQDGKIQYHLAHLLLANLLFRMRETKMALEQSKTRSLTTITKSTLTGILWCWQIQRSRHCQPGL